MSRGYVKLEQQRKNVEESVKRPRGLSVVDYPNV